MATKQDVAQLAGVSPATVSNFYNGKKKMSADTQIRIIEAARSLNFSLPETHKTQKKKTKATYLVVEDIFNPHHGAILQGMNSVAFNYGIPVSMIQLWDNVDAFCSMLIANDVYAVFFTTMTRRLTDNHIEFLRSNDILVYHSNNDYSIDNDLLIEQAVRHLKDLGHKRIAYLSGLSINNPANARYRSFLRAMEVNHIPAAPELIIDGVLPYHCDAKSGYWAMNSFLKKHTDFTAVIAHNDLLAFGAINALQENGLSIPGDVSVIGCDDIVLAEFSNPPLTTLRYSAADIGRLSMYSIINCDQPYENRTPVVLQSELIVRKSSGKAPN